MPYPTIAEKLFAKSAFGVAKESSYRTPQTASSFTPFTACTLEFNPAIFSPPVMIGVRSTHIYNLSGEQKLMGAVSAPLYSVNGLPLLVAALGQDNTAGNGIYGIPAAESGGDIHAGTGTSFASAGVTSIGLTGITGVFAVGQSIAISGDTDPDTSHQAPDVVRITAFGSPTVTCTPTAQIHTGTITVTVVGSSAPGTEAPTDTTITVQTGQGALFTTGDIVTIDVNGAGTTSETKKVTVAGDVLTLDTALKFAHGANAVVYHVASTGIFLHTITLGDPDSFTFEKNIANTESLQFAGARVGKLTLHAPMGNVAATVAADIAASAIAIMPTPTAVVTDPNPPFVFAEAELSIYDVIRSEAYNCQVVLDNQLKETYTYSGQHFPSYITATNLHVSGSFDAIWNSFDDATTGYFAHMQAGTEGIFSFILRHVVDGSFVKMTLPRVRLSKDDVAPTPANIAIQVLAFEARYAIEAANPSPLTLLLGVPGLYTPY